MKKIKIENKFLKKVVVLGITLVLITSFLVPAGILNIRNVFGNLFYKADGSVKAEGNPLPVLLSDPPLGFTATANSRTQIYLSWTKNSTADTTYIERNNAETWNLGEGTMVYNDSGTSHQDSGLNPGTQYFYQAWSWNYTDLYSITYEEANTTTFTNQPPVLSGEKPLDDSGNIDIMQTTVNVTIRDPEGDSFNWTIEGVYVTNSGQDNDVNGSKSANLITPLPNGTDIVWFVNVTDGYSWTNATYNFTTRFQYILNPPGSFTVNVKSGTQINLSWTKDIMADTTYIERNNAETWNLGEGTMVYNDSGTSHQDSGLSPGTQYFYQAWSWNDTDHLFSTSYEEDSATTFTNQPPVLSWEIPVDDSGNIDIMQATVNVTIRDPEGDSFNWTIEGLYVTNSGQDNDVNGSKSASLITPLPYDTDIVWFVNVTDGYSWTNATYNFTTRVQYATGVGVIEGIVKNWGSGEPLEDAYVYIVGGHFNLSEFDIALVATKEQTNAEGKYQAVDVPSGLYIILVLRNGSGSLSDGWFPALRYTSVNPGETTVENFELISLSRSTSVKMFSRVPEFHLFYVDKLISMFLK